MWYPSHVIPDTDRTVQDQDGKDVTYCKYDGWIHNDRMEEVIRWWDHPENVGQGVVILKDKA